MNKNSILFKLNLIFILTFIVSTALFLFVYITLQRQSNFEFIRKSMLLVRTKNLNAYAQSENINIINNTDEINNILKHAKVLLKKEMPAGRQNWVLFKFKSNTYLYIHTPYKNFLLKKGQKFSAPDFILILWVVFIVSILFLYISILKSIYPIKVLRKKIEEFKKGNLDINFELKRKDEVGFLAKEFQEAISNLKKSTESRQWFLRNVAHELKTPIAKGMIASELLNDENRKQNFLTIFKRLDVLINELLSIEQIAAKNIEDSSKCYKFSQILESAKKLLFLENEKVKYKPTINYTIKVDIDFFTIAIKNLLDNGIKFSSDNTISIYEKNNKIIFSNMGEKSQIDVDKMFEPFSKETSLKNKEGMGLGLYVTKYILDKHNVKVTYAYENGENMFILDIKHILCNN
ncbi:two-component system, OmpR family, sensor kinase [Desulfurella multipotens]|uniref:histidine kinase n=1 Tax=Desulfurella multipotens TaxID=79269 RepID=A0A1G6N6D5_9BACT|nr:ArsS family sensor histidine kinase [Desulfurella multipotens]SDC62957.1 two-component system, OmpR family, sensor kinase [Desulfurella multipotens]